MKLIAVCCGMCTVSVEAEVQSAVCVIEAGCFNVFTSDGRDYVASLPFPVRLTVARKIIRLQCVDAVDRPSGRSSSDCRMLHNSVIG